jgi:oxygen-independent coproporphyrinogen-3 oxidase
MFRPGPALLAATAPRYTSYPPATRFEAAVGPEVYSAWLGDLDPDAELSLYLHIPYCRSICWYCGCHAVATRRDEPILAYAETLAAEIDLVAETTPARRVTQIHWGGGTPSILSPETFLRLINRLADRMDLSGLEEHAIEADPRIMTDRQAAAFAISGVNRVSFGVQDLNPKVQEAIGRPQPFAMVKEAADCVRQAGIGALNFDLMFGLPGQTVADARNTAELAASLSPDRIAAFGYAHVPWFKTRQRLIEEPALPGPEERLAQAAAMRDTLIAAGYVEIGFDHFAKRDDAMALAAQSGVLARNFQGYVARQPAALVGLGASAISSLPQGYAQNATGLTEWREAIGQGRFATARGAVLSEDDRRRRTVIERLLCDFAVDLSAYGGLAAFPDALEPLASLAAEGVVRVRGERVEATDGGRAFVRLLAQAFDAYRSGDSARQSRAV